MMFFGWDIKVWFTVFFAALFKIWTTRSPERSKWATAATGVFAIFCPVMFTDSVLDFLGWTESSQIVVAAMLTLTGEGIMRWFVTLTPEKVISIWRDFK